MILSSRGNDNGRRADADAARAEAKSSTTIRRRLAISIMTVPRIFSCNMFCNVGLFAFAVAHVTAATTAFMS